MYSLERLLRAVRAGTPERVQARLLSASDRDLAAILSAMDAEDREAVLARIGSAKRLRVEEGIERMRLVRLTPEQTDRIALHLAAHIEEDKPRGPASSYFRPHRQTGDPD